MKSAESGSADAGSDLARALREAISLRGVTLVWLRDRLVERGCTVSLTTLSYWRSGRRRPEGAQSMAALAEAEVLLGLDAGHLTSRLGPNRRPGPRHKPVIPEFGQGLRQAAEETLRELAAAPMERLCDLTTHVTADVDEHGEQRRRTLRTLLQATSGVVTEVPFVEVVGDRVEEGPRFRALAGCRIGRAYDHPCGQVFGVVLELERPLVAPESVMLELQVDWPDGSPGVRECEHAVARQNRETLLWVRFHPERLPVRVEQYSVIDGREEVSPIDLRGRSSVHAVARSFGPGQFGLRWEF